jgi:hypothetical protein
MLPSVSASFLGCEGDGIIIVECASDHRGSGRDELLLIRSCCKLVESFHW